MDPTTEELAALFGYGEDDLPLGVIVIHAPGTNPFLREGIQFLDEVPVMVYYDRPERQPEETVIQYLGGLLAPHDYRLERTAREKVLLSGAQPAYSKPPRSLGRSTPARCRPIRGAKLSNGGWR
ncbi:MAG: hypothetical protein AAB921_00920 [Patescibacteria group bacterium]